MTTTEVLIHARAFIEEHGWTQGRFMAEDGSVCVMGAVRMTIYGTTCPGQIDRAFRTDDHYVQARRMLKQAAGHKREANNPTTYNDYECHSKADALNWLDRAIEVSRC